MLVRNGIARQTDPDMATPDLIDQPLRLQRLLRAARRRVAGADFLMIRACEDLLERLMVVDRRFEAPVALFSRTPDAASAIAASGRASGPVRRVEQHTTFLGDEPGVIAPDPGKLDLEAQSADLVVCVNAMHAVDDVSRLLATVRHALRPDGLFMAAIPAAGTLLELRESLLAAEAESGAASPHVLPFVDIRQAGALLQQAGFALPVTDVETVTIRYDDMFALMADLRAMGETNPLLDRARKPATRALFARAAAHYAARFADGDGRIRATFNTVWMSGWAPHPAQPRPLRPGSATVPLARVLRGSEER